MSKMADVQLRKNDHGFGLSASLSKSKIHFFLLFTTIASYFSSFKLPYKIQLPAFRSPLNSKITQHDKFTKAAILQKPFPAKNVLKQTTYLLLEAKNSSYFNCVRAIK